jgi:nucleotide-binding universal stress UspA family protein
MRTYTRILCPIDFSTFSKAALDEATSLGKDMSAELCLLHAFQNPSYVLPLSGYVGPAGEVVGRIREQLGHELEALAAGPRGRGLNVQTLVLEGAPYSCIVDYAKEWHADLIVMGTHGRTGLSHMLTGSVAERVVRLAPCSVLVTRSKE